MGGTLFNWCQQLLISTFKDSLLRKSSTTAHNKSGKARWLTHCGIREPVSNHKAADIETKPDLMVCYTDLMRIGWSPGMLVMSVENPSMSLQVIFMRKIFFFRGFSHEDVVLKMNLYSFVEVRFLQNPLHWTVTDFQIFYSNWNWGVGTGLLSQTHEICLYSKFTCFLSIFTSTVETQTWRI